MIGQMLLGVASATQNRAIQAVSAMVAVPAAATALHAIGVSNDLDAAGLSRGLLDGGLWLTLGMAAAFGALGGVTAELMSLHGHVEMPHKPRRNRYHRSRLADPKNEIDLGVVSRMVLGAAAALALLAIYTPGSATALLVNALIAGSAATSVFRLVQGRMLGQSQSQPSPWIKSNTREVQPKSTAPRPVAA